MGDSLPAINVDQLTDSVNNAVHGNLQSLPFPTPCFPPPSDHANPNAELAEVPSRLPPVSGCSCLPVFNPLPDSPMSVQLPGSSTVNVTLINNSSNTSTNCDSAAAGTTLVSMHTATVLSSTNPAPLPSTPAVSSSSSAVGSSAAHSLSTSISGCPPVFIMFSLRFPVPHSVSQGRNQESLASSSTTLASARLPPLPPFPLLLPILTPSQDDHQLRSALSFPDKPTAAASSACMNSLSLHTTSLSQGFPLTSGQLSSSLPVLTLPAQSSAMSQSDVTLPPLLLQSSAAVSGSLPLHSFLHPPSNSVVPFPCPPPPFSYSGSTTGQTTLHLPSFPQQSFPAFVQSGLPVTSLSTSSLSISDQLPRPSSSVHEGHVSSQPPVPQLAVLQSKAQPLLGGASCAQFPASNFSSAAFQPVGYPAIPPLPTAVPTCARFSLLPTFPVPPHTAAVSDTGFLPPLSVQVCSASSAGMSLMDPLLVLQHPANTREAGFTLPASLPVPLSCSLLSGTSGVSAGSMFVSMAGQPPQFSPFPAPTLPPFLFVPETHIPPPPASSCSYFNQTKATLAQTKCSTASCKRSHDGDEGKGPSQEEERPSAGNAASPCNGSPQHIRTIVEEGMCMSVESHNNVTTRFGYFNNAERTSHIRKGHISESVDSSRSPPHPVTMPDAGNCQIERSAFCAVSSSVGSDKVPLYMPVRSSSDMNNFTASQSSVLFGVHSHCPQSHSPVSVPTTQSCGSCPVIPKLHTTNCHYLPGVIASSDKTQRKETCISGLVTEMALQSEDRNLMLPSYGSTSTICLSEMVPSSAQTSVMRCNFLTPAPIAFTKTCSAGQKMQPFGKTAVQKADLETSCTLRPQSDELTKQRSDPCSNSVCASPPNRTIEKHALHQIQGGINQNSDLEHTLSLSSVYPVDEAQELNQDFALLQQFPGVHPFSKILPSCAIEARKKPEQNTQKQQSMESEASSLSAREDSPSAFHHVASSFSEIQGSSSLSLVSSVREDLNKVPPVSSDSCQFHASLSSLATDFSSAPTISVDQPSQTLLPGVGYSPPGLSNQGLSPNLFSPLGMNAMEQTMTSKVDPSLHVVASNSDGGVTGISLGLSTVSASVLDMFLLKADTSSVDRESTESTSVTTRSMGGLTTQTIYSEPHEIHSMGVIQKGSLELANSKEKELLTNVAYSEKTGKVTEVPSSVAEADATEVSDRHSLLPVFSGQFCVECDKMCSQTCQHGAIQYQHVADSPVLTKAKASLPECLQFGQSGVIGHINTTGVFTKEPLVRQTQFGPLQGKLLPLGDTAVSASFGHWKIFYKDSVQVMDVTEEKDSNWLMFVKPARNALERNMVAFQRGHYIMFVVTKDLPPQAELLFWFAPDYCRMLLGTTKTPQFCPYCPSCSHVFFDRSQLHHHSRQVHGDNSIKKWSCSVCSVQFRSAGKLNDHVMTQHMNLKPYVCPTCGKEFADPRNLNTHLNIHTGIKRFGCDICGKHFMQKAHLQSHQATHTKVKSAQCKVCSKHFVRLSDMRQHELTHSQDNLLSCQQCSKTFHRPKLLRRHMRSVHNNVRNYLCEHCSKTFHTKYKLTRHAQSCKSLKSSRTSSLSTQTPQYPSALPVTSISPQSAPPLSVYSSQTVSSVGSASVSVCAANGGSVSVSDVHSVVGTAAQGTGQSLQEEQYSPANEEESLRNHSVMAQAHKGSSFTITSLPVLINSIS